MGIDTPTALCNLKSGSFFQGESDIERYIEGGATPAGTYKSTASNFTRFRDWWEDSISRAGSSPVICSNADLVELADTPERISVLCFFENMSSLDGKTVCKPNRCRFDPCSDI